MHDLLVAFVAMLLISLFVTWLTVKVTRPWSNRKTTLVGVLVGALLVGYVQRLWAQPVLATLLPSSALLIWGNWFPYSAAFLAGITWTHGYGTKLRRGLFGAAAYVISVYSVVEPIYGSSPLCRDVWQGKICMQTSQETCSAAAAATLLAQFGVSAQESEMAELCLTRNGTTWMGLYRGLKLKTADLPLEVKVFECSAHELVANFKGPEILTVGVPVDRPYPEIYTEEWGWQKGVRHSVVLLDVLPNGRIVIADPSVGLEEWTAEDLKILWLGRGVRLQSRS